MMAHPITGTMRRPWRATAVCLISLVAAAPLARAADDEIVAESVPAAGGPRQPHMIDLAMNFDANLFEQRGDGWVIRGASGRRDAAAARPPSPALEKGRQLGLKRIERIESACRITPEQKRLLLLAVESDVRRFAAEIEAVRDRYAGRQVNMNDQAGQREWHAFQQDVRRCREQLRDLFAAGSLFATVLAATLDQPQQDCLAAENAARRSYHWRAMVLEVVAKLDDTLGLDQRQHEVIVGDLLAREPLLRTDADSLGRDDANLRRNLVLMVLSGGDARSIRAAVSERQWRTLSQLMNQGRAMRSWIEQQGVLEAKP
jgi:hypothetical protein